MQTILPKKLIWENVLLLTLNFKILMIMISRSVWKLIPMPLFSRCLGLISWSLQTYCQAEELLVKYKQLTSWLRILFILKPICRNLNKILADQKDPEEETIKNIWSKLLDFRFVYFLLGWKVELVVTTITMMMLQTRVKALSSFSHRWITEPVIN